MRERTNKAASAEAEELWDAIRLQHPEALSLATLNRHLTDDMAVFIAKNRNAPAETLGHLAEDVRFRDLYRMRLALAKNPKCPPRVALGQLKFLRVFDLADLSRNQVLPILLRQKVEFMLAERIASMPSGIKLALSKRVSCTLVIKLIEHGDPRVIASCLDSPILIEEDVRRLISLPRTKGWVIKAISEHQRWSLRHVVQYSLMRNFYTPMVRVEHFIGTLRTPDLQELYSDKAVPASTRPFIYRELMRREAGLEPEPDEVFEVSEDTGDLDDLAMDL